MPSTAWADLHETDKRPRQGSQVEISRASLFCDQQRSQGVLKTASPLPNYGISATLARGSRRRCRLDSRSGAPQAGFPNFRRREPSIPPDDAPGSPCFSLWVGNLAAHLPAGLPATFPARPQTHGIDPTHPDRSMLNASPRAAFHRNIRPEEADPMGDSLVVKLAALTRASLVRIQVPQPLFS